MHMVSKKDLNKAELESVRIFKNPIIVVTANGENANKRRGNGIPPRTGLIRDGKTS